MTASPDSMTNVTTPRRPWKWARRLLIVGLVGLTLQQIWRHGRDYVFADQFAVVEPGKIYRGAWQQDWPMRRLVRDRQIKTIVALAHPSSHPMTVAEKGLAAELGCRWLHIPIVDDRSEGNQGQMLFDRLEEAAAAIAAPENQPVYFHCHHGVNRASMAQMAYRMLYSGWTLEAATAEIARTFGLKRADHGPDYRHMAKFYRERVLPRRLAEASKSATAVEESAESATSRR